MPTVLVVDDEPRIVDLARDYLEHAGFEVVTASDGEAALAVARERQPDLVVLDLGLPDGDGVTLCRRLRDNDVHTPVLMLTARDGLHEKVAGLDAGADDYLTKPFSVLELVARVRAIYRRIDNLQFSPQQAHDASQRVTIGNLSIDSSRREVRLDDQLIDLTAREFDLLSYFARNPGRVFRRADLLDEVWGYGHEGYEHTVNSHINRLRAKIEHNPSKPEMIVTVWGVGYKFAARNPLNVAV